MKKYLLSITVIITLFAFASTSPAASFDCAKASTKIEKMICADGEISALDEQLAVAYKKALSSSANKDELKQEQRAWLSKIRNKCQEPRWLKQVYLDRIIMLTPPSPEAAKDSDVYKQMSFEEALKNGIQTMLKQFRQAKKINMTVKDYFQKTLQDRVQPKNPPSPTLVSFCNRLETAILNNNVKKAPFAPLFSSQEETLAKISKIRETYHQRTLKDGFGPDSRYEDNCRKLSSGYIKGRYGVRKYFTKEYTAASCLAEYKERFLSVEENYFDPYDIYGNGGDIEAQYSLYCSGKLWNGEDRFMFIIYTIEKEPENPSRMQFQCGLILSDGTIDGCKFGSERQGMVMFEGHIISWGAYFSEDKKTLKYSFDTSHLPVTESGLGTSCNFELKY